MNEVELTDPGIIFHEINNVMASLTASLGDLANREADAEKKKRLQATSRSAKSIAHLLKSLRSPGSQLGVSLHGEDALMLLNEAMQEAEPEAERRGVRLRLIPDRELVCREHRVVVDRELTRRLLVNLIFNAVDASLEGDQVTVVASCRERGVKISVCDHGPGLPGTRVQDLPRGYSTRTGEDRGTGLSVCRSIAALHGARLESRNLDTGLEVYFVLPLVQPPERMLTHAGFACSATA